MNTDLFRAIILATVMIALPSQATETPVAPTATAGDQDEATKVIQFKSSEDSITAIINGIDSLKDTEKKELIQSIENVNDDFNIDIDLASGETNGLAEIVGIFGLPLMVVIVVCYYRYRKDRLKSETIKNYLNAGQQVPTEILQVVPVEDSLHSGIRYIAKSIGLYLALGLLINWKIAVVGVFPLFLGLGNLLVWYINRNRDNAAKQAD